MNNNDTESDGVTDSTGLNVQTYYKCETCGRELQITTKCSTHLTLSDTDRKTANEVLGLTETYHHDIDEKSLKCKKCAQHIKELKLKTCPVVGAEEFKNYGK